MKSAFFWAVVSGVLLASFLYLRPVIGQLGEPASPYGRLAPAPGAGTKTPAKPPTPGSASFRHLDRVDELVLELTNRERQLKKLPRLKNDRTLGRIAQSHSDDMLACKFCGHVNPLGQSVMDRTGVGHRCLIGTVGENIWSSSGKDFKDNEELAAKIVSGWMNNPGHRENILRPEFNYLGVGVSADGQEVRATQVFANAQAFTESEIPSRVKRKAILNLQAGPHIPVKMDYWLASKGKVAAGPIDLVKGQGVPVEVDPGVYRLRFYFTRPAGGGWVIFPGPQLEVDK